MSNFLLNIARRSAGLGPGAVVEPAPGPMFVPTVSNAETLTHDADAEGQSERVVQSRPAVPARSKRTVETKQHISRPGEKQSRRHVGTESRSEPDANKPGLPMSDAGPTVKGREAATDPFATSVVGNISFNGSAAGQPFDPQPRSLQSIIEPQPSADLHYPNETKSNLDELRTDGPRQAREPLSTVLTPRLSEAPGKKEPSVAKSQSDPIKDVSETVAPAATGVISSDSLWESHRQQGPAVMPLLPQPIQVRIGTIEVRAEQVPQPGGPMNASSVPQSGFDDYKFIR